MNIYDHINKVDDNTKHWLYTDGVCKKCLDFVYVSKSGYGCSNPSCEYRNKDVAIGER